MPKTQAELYTRIIEINRRAFHHRGLGSSYGYNAILDVDLVARCLDLRERFAPPIRILDVGCGDGLALKQLAEGLAKAGADPADFSCWGMGLNRYDDILIEPDRFIETGLIAYRSNLNRFHLIVSVFTFHYMWHKLEGIEKIYNQLLVEGGFAFLHFPGYLVRWGESPAAITQTEVVGNTLFTAFLSRLEAAGDIAPMHYRLIPYYSDDDDRSLLAEFGNLHFEKCRETPICFGQSLMAFALFTHGFNFARMNRSPLTYVASHYAPTDPGPRTAPPLPPYRIETIPMTIPRRTFQIDVAIHAFESECVTLICPGACEPLAGKAIDYVPVAEQIERAGLGAVVRYNDPYDHQGDYPELVLESLRSVLAFTLDNARNFCATGSPRVRVMAYSSSCGAVAALAADYPCIEAILLVAPSFDVPRQTILAGLRRFTGRVYVIIGDADRIILPQQAFWFYKQARAAYDREYVEVPGCGHDFEEAANRAIFIRSPLWAFGDTRPDEFPAARTSCTKFE